MLHRSGRKHRQTLKALTDPQPEFVSLVFGGANKTPFRALRADGTAAVEEEMTAKTDTRAIVKVEFAGNKFADETAVKTWLSNGGYDDSVVIAKTDEGFMVDNTSGLDKDTVLSLIDLSDTSGVKVFTVAVKADALELTEKEMHPGATLLDLTTELYDSVRKSMVRGEKSAKDAVDAFMNNFADLIGKMPDLGDENFAAMVEAVAPEIEVEKVEDKEETMSTENIENAEKGAPGKKVEATQHSETAPHKLPESDRAPHGQQDAEEEGEGGAVDSAVHGEDGRMTSPEAAATGSGDEADNGDKKKKKSDEEVSEEDSGEVAEKAAEPDAVAALTALVAELTTSVKSMGENLSNELKVVVERVAAVEETRQTRKGADVDDTSASSEAKPTVSEGIADLRAKAMLGMRKR